MHRTSKPNETIRINKLKSAMTSIFSMLVIADLNILFPIKKRRQGYELYLSAPTQVIGSNFETMHLNGKLKSLIYSKF